MSKIKVKSSAVYAESLRWKITALALKHEKDRSYQKAINDVWAAIDELEKAPMTPPYAPCRDDVRTCSMCGERGTVIDVETMKNGFLRRRRRCVECGERWTTWEIAADK